MGCWNGRDRVGRQGVMKQRRRVFAVFVSIVLVSSIGLLAQNKDDKKRDDAQKKEIQNIVKIVDDGAAGQNPMKISRSFTVSAGAYDVFVVAKEPTPEKAPKNAPPPKMSMIKQAVTVPDFWNGDLATSSVIIAQRIDPLATPLTPQQQA